MTSDGFLQLQSLDYSLEDGRRRFRLQARNLSAGAGERIALVGPSGTGKSTLLELLCLQRQPGAATHFVIGDADGNACDIRVAWAERDEKTLGRLRARTLGLSPQRGGYFPALTVLDNARLRGDLAEREPKQTGDRVRILADAFGLGRRQLNARPDALSMGERQRAMLLQALVHRPRIVVADEPTAALHPTQAGVVLGALSELCREAGAALIISTHDIALADRLGFTKIEAVSSGTDEEVATSFDGGASV